MAATAFVLAAGLGTRLRPLTLTTPKPLLPIRGRPMLDHVVDHLRRYGHDEIVVNAFWLAERVVEWARGRPGVHVVVEQPRILGTGGGLKHAAHLLAERFVVLNGDILSDVDLAALWREPGDAVMALRRQARPVHTGVALRADGVVTGIRGVVGEGDPGLHFTGVHVMDRALLDLIPDGEQCVIRTVYKARIPAGTVRGIVHTGAWVDIGTPEEYAAVNAGG